MSEPQGKYGQYFSKEIEPSDRDKMWRGIRMQSGTRTARSRKTLMFGFGFAAAAILAVSVHARSAAPLSAGPLKLQQSGASVPSDWVAEQPMGMVFDDRSEVYLQQGAKVGVLDNSANRFSLKQPQGHAHYQVTPNGPRRWTVDTPMGSIEVVGTGFDVEADADHLRVNVEHGVVLVRGEYVPEHVQRLTDGQMLEVSKPAPTEIVQPAHAQELSGPKAKADIVGIDAVQKLWNAADQERAAGHVQAAVLALEEIVAMHPTDKRAGLAALTLGRMRMDSLGQPERAAIDFENAARLGMAQALRDDATVRRCEALDASGQHDAASVVASEWVKARPSSKARFVRWLP